MNAPLLRLVDISKSFGAVRALQQVSFELAAGEVHGLVGENGAGKSTLVQLITGAQSPDAGKIELDGRQVHHLTPSRARQLGIACVYQHPALFPDLSVAENIALRLAPSPALGRVDWKARARQAERLLQTIGTGIAPEAPAGELSMPHQQLVELACALGLEARIILLDEPTASLTQHEQQLLYNLVRQLRGEGRAIVYVSHRLEEIFALTDRVTILRDGRLVRTHPTNQLTEASLIHGMVGREVLVEESVAPASVPGGSPRPDRLPDSAPNRDASSPRPAVLTVRQLCCAAGGLRGIDFELHAGEILGLAGLVGAGRTELARTLFGITPADDGEIRLEGRRVVINSPRAGVDHGIAYVPEDRTRHGLILDLPLTQNITLAIHRRIFPHGWLRTAAERDLACEYIHQLNVTPPVPEARAAALSGGNQQKISLARWLAAKPRVLILDEPTQGVDVGAKSEIHRIIRRLAKEGMAVLLISSDLPELLALSDRVGVMRGGRLVRLLPGKSPPQQVMAAAFGSPSAYP